MTITDDSRADKLDHQVYLKEISNILEANDLSRLTKVFSVENGLINNEVREQAWPIMIKSDTVDVPKYSDLGNIHKDDEQVKKDVDRSFISLDSNKYDCQMVGELRNRLHRLILKVLIALPELNYYQGYHDVASIVVLVFSDDIMAYRFLYCLSLKYLRDHMMCNIDPTVKQLDIIPELVKSIDLELYEVINNVAPVYALSSIISLFTHDITNVDYVAVVWDFIFLKGSPQMVIYIYVALLVYYKEEIFIELNEMSDSSLNTKSDFDLDIVHAVLNKFIGVHFNSFSIDSKHELFNVLMLADRLCKKHRLKKLKTFCNLSNYSFLKRRTYSLLILKLQSKEVLLEASKKTIKHNINNKPKISSTLIFTRSKIFKLSLGVGIIGIILNATLRGGSFNRSGIIAETTRKFHLFWDFIFDRR